MSSPLIDIGEQNPWKSQQNKKVTQETIKRMLANGTPDWVRFPNDYKAFMQESFAAEKEQSDSQVLGYKMEDQELFTDEKARKVNPIGTRDFIKKLRDNGVKCFTIENGMPGTVGLWAGVATDSGLDAKYICYLQIPAMYEWSVLRLDAHNLPAGEKFRGWRTVLSQLIKNEVLTETKAHEIFGTPTDSYVSRRYRETLFYYRNHADLKAENKTAEL